MATDRDALRAAIDALEEIALAGMSGSGQESEEGMRDWHARQAWKFIGIAARALEPARAALAAPPVEQQAAAPDGPGPGREQGRHMTEVLNTIAAWSVLAIWFFGAITCILWLARMPVRRLGSPTAMPKAGSSCARQCASTANAERSPAMADAQTPVLTDDRARYRFLLGFLIERGVLTDKRYGSGTWCLRGVYGVDDSGLKGAGRSPEEALDNAIVATNLDPGAAQKFWSETHAALELQGCACRWRADEIVSECEVHTAWRDTLHEYAERLRAQPDRAVMQQALDALLGVRSNMQQNAPHLSGKVWGDADAAIAALSASIGQISEPRDG